MTARVKQIIRMLQNLGDRDVAIDSQRFFKTGRGEYGEGDKFLGIRVPVIRQCAREHRDISLKETVEVMKSPYHEARLLAVLLLVTKYRSAKTKSEQKAIYDAYLQNTKYINNWDLIDSSAHYVVGSYLSDKSRKPLYRIARSKSLWERRIAIMSTCHFIKDGEFSDTLSIAEVLLNDKEDLIHKAVGWMLREVGNKNRKVEEQFLKKHYKSMPRTMLRYAIEKFPENRRQAYLKGSV